MQPIANQLLQAYLKLAFRIFFQGIHYSKSTTQLTADVPILLCPNHSSWWDGFFAYALNRQIFKRDFHILMLERELKLRPFFRHVGALGISPERPSTLRTTFNRLNGLLSQTPGKLLTFFPQGKLLPAVAPLELKRGLKYLQAPPHTQIIPAYFHTEAGINARPRAFLNVGIDQALPFAQFRLHPELLQKRLQELRQATYTNLLNPQTWNTLCGKPFDGFGHV